MIIDNIDLTQEYKYDIVLCRSYDREQISALSEIMNFQYHPKLSGYNEIEFDMPKFISTNQGEKIENENYDLTMDGYLILVNDKEYFIIESPEESGGDKDYKHIIAYGYEKTLNQRNLIDFEGTYQIYPDEVEVGDGVLERFLEDNPEWNIGFIDDKVRKDNVAEGQNHNKYRTFEIPEKSWYLFLTEDFSTAFSCLVIFDTLNMTINLYDKDSIGEDKGLYISEKNYLKSIKKKIASDKIVTRLVCTGKDGLVFNEINPTGQSWVYDYFYYRNLNYMPQALLDTFNAYDTLVESKQGEFSDLLAQINTLDGQIIDCEAQLIELKSQYSNIKTSIAIAMATGTGDVTALNVQLASKQTEINNKQVEIDGLKVQLDTLKSQKVALVNSLSFESNFTTEQLKIVNKYGMHTTWKNETIIRVDDLFAEGKKALKELNTPTIEIDVDNANFLKIVECQHDWNKLVMGDITTVEYKKLKIDVQLRLIEYTHNPQSNTLKMIFSNRLFKEDLARQIGNGISKAISNGNIISKKKYIWDLAETNNMSIQDIMNNNLDLMRQSVTNSDNTVNIDKNGILLVDKTNPMNQLYITNGVIGMSIDGGETFKLGATSEGIVAETIIGELILSERLYIKNSNASLVINDQGITLAGTQITITGGLPDNQIASANTWNNKVSKDSIISEINLSTEGIRISGDKVSIDAGNMVIDGNTIDISANESIINKVSKSDMSAEITQHADSVKIAMGQIGGNNLVLNGDFEFDNLAPVYYYDLNVAMWENQTGVYSTAPSGDKSSDGSKFFYMRILHNEVDGAIGTLLYYINKKFTVKPNAKYTFSCDIQSMNCKAMYGVSYYDSSDVRIGYEELGGEFYSTWVRHSWNGVSPSNAAYARAFFSIVPLNNGAWQEYRAEFDKFKMEEGENATAWSSNANESKGTTYTFDGDNFEMKNANYTTILSPTGIAQCDNIFANDNVDASNPLIIPFNIDSETNRVDKILIKIQSQAFRAYSKGAISGGGTKSTPAGGNGTAGVDDWTNNYNTVSVFTNTEGNQFWYKTAVEHKHNTPSHTHSVDITHAHEIDYGIYQQASVGWNMSVVIDGTTRITDLYGTQILDITQWITTSGWHTVEITSIQNGRVAANLYIKSYVGY